MKTSPAALWFFPVAGSCMRRVTEVEKEEEEKFRGAAHKRTKKKSIKTCVMRKHVVCNYWKSSTTENN